MATMPDSKPPSSLEVPMKGVFTAETRSRFSSGVRSCTMVWRMTTLTLSAAPQMTSKAKESAARREDRVDRKFRALASGSRRIHFAP